MAFHAHYAAMGMASATTCLHPKKHLQLLPLYRTNGLSFNSTQPLSASPKPNKLTIFVAAEQQCAPQDVEQYLSLLSMLQIAQVGNASQSSPCWFSPHLSDTHTVKCENNIKKCTKYAKAIENWAVSTQTSCTYNLSQPLSMYNLLQPMSYIYPPPH